MVTGSSQAPDTSRSQQSGLSQRKPWLIVICATIIICLLLVGGLTLAGPMIGDFVSHCQLVVEPAPGTVLPYSRVQEGIPFSATADLTYTSSGSPSHAVTHVLALKSNTGDMFASEDELADIGGVMEWECPLLCQITVEGTLHPEAVYQGKITLLVSTGFVNDQSGMGYGGCLWTWIEYPVSGAP